MSLLQYNCSSLLECMSLASYIYCSYCCVTMCKDIGKYISSDRYCTIMWFIHVFAWMIISMHWWYSSYWLFPNTINNLQFAFERTFREHEGARAGHKLEKRIIHCMRKFCSVRTDAFFLSVVYFLLPYGVSSMAVLPSFKRGTSHLAQGSSWCCSKGCYHSSLSRSASSQLHAVVLVEQLVSQRSLTHSSLLR